MPGSSCGRRVCLARSSPHWSIHAVRSVWSHRHRGLAPVARDGDLRHADRRSGVRSGSSTWPPRPGSTFLNSADVYPLGAGPDEVGRSEEITGRWLRSRRDRFIVGTKAGGPMGRAMGVAARRASTCSTRSTGRSAAWAPTTSTCSRSTPTTRRRRWTRPRRHWTRSCAPGRRATSGRRTTSLIGSRGPRAQDTLRLVRFACIQPRYNLLFREVERELLPLAQEGSRGDALQPARGRPADRQVQGRRDAAGRSFLRGHRQVRAVYQARYWKAREFEAVERIAGVARTHGLSRRRWPSRGRPRFRPSRPPSSEPPASSSSTRRCRRRTSASTPEVKAEARRAHGRVPPRRCRALATARPAPGSGARLGCADVSGGVIEETGKRARAGGYRDRARRAPAWRRHDRRRLPAPERQGRAGDHRCRADRAELPDGRRRRPGRHGRGVRRRRVRRR